MLRDNFNKHLKWDMWKFSFWMEGMFPLLETGSVGDRKKHEKALIAHQPFPFKWYEL